MFFLKKIAKIFSIFFFKGQWRSDLIPETSDFFLARLHVFITSFIFFFSKCVQFFYKVSKCNIDTGDDDVFDDDNDDDDDDCVFDDDDENKDGKSSGQIDQAVQRGSIEWIKYGRRGRK